MLSRQLLSWIKLCIATNQQIQSSGENYHIISYYRFHYIIYYISIHHHHINYKTGLKCYYLFNSRSVPLFQQQAWQPLLIRSRRYFNCIVLTSAQTTYPKVEAVTIATLPSSRRHLYLPREPPVPTEAIVRRGSWLVRFVQVRNCVVARRNITQQILLINNLKFYPYLFTTRTIKLRRFKLRVSSY